MSSAQEEEKKTVIYWQPEDTRPIERTRIIHRFTVKRVFNIEVHSQGNGWFCIDIETAKGCNPDLSYSETFDQNVLYPAVLKELEDMKY